mgnify:FL=1
MIIHKDKIIFRTAYLNTEEGRMSQTENDNFKKLKKDIEKNGIINPLICTEKNGMYRLSIGMRRFIAGCLLGIKEYEVIIVENEKIETLKDSCKKYKTTHKNGTLLAV